MIDTKYVTLYNINMNMQKKYVISDIMQELDVTKRTVHYYIGRGLIPPAKKDGDMYYYDEDHLIRIRYIRWMAEQHISLQAISLQMKGKSNEALLAEMEKAPVLMLNVEQPADKTRVSYRIHVQDGIELNLDDEVYHRIKHKVDMMTDYIRKIVREN